MEVLTLNGKQYVKASKVAKDLGYASDYVGQLCRSGAVDAHLVGRAWYVNPDTLGAHRVEKKRNARVKAREYAKKSIEEVKQLHLRENTNKPQNIVIHYEKDPQGLFPEVKQMHIAKEERIAETEQESQVGPSYEIQNEHKKIVMSGKIQVFDADEETVLTDVTILTPKLVRHQQTRKGVARGVLEDSPKAQEVPKGNLVSVREGKDIQSVPISFLDRLSAQQEGESPRADTYTAEEVDGSLAELTKGESGLRGHMLRGFLTMAVLLSVCTLFIQFEYDFNNGKLERSIRFVVPDIEKAFKI